MDAVERLRVTTEVREKALRSFRERSLRELRGAYVASAFPLVVFAAVLVFEPSSRQWWLGCLGLPFVLLGLAVAPVSRSVMLGHVDRARSLQWDRYPSFEDPSGQVAYFGPDGVLLEGWGLYRPSEFTVLDYDAAAHAVSLERWTLDEDRRFTTTLHLPPELTARDGAELVRLLREFSGVAHGSRRQG